MHSAVSRLEGGCIIDAALHLPSCLTCCFSLGRPLHLFDRYQLSAVMNGTVLLVVHSHGFFGLVLQNIVQCSSLKPTALSMDWRCKHGSTRCHSVRAGQIQLSGREPQSVSWSCAVTPASTACAVWGFISASCCGNQQQTCTGVFLRAMLGFGNRCYPATAHAPTRPPLWAWGTYTCLLVAW